MFGYETARKLIGTSWKELYTSEEITRFEREVFPILSQAGSWRGEAIAKRRNGSTFNEEVSLTLTEESQNFREQRDFVRLVRFVG